MGKLTKVPSKAASGAETFSDALVGVQITNGSTQLTNTNFDIDREIPEKDSKNFVTQPFSEFFTLNDIKLQSSTGVDTTPSGKKTDIKFKNSYDNGNCSLYGSLKERIGVSLTNIISTFPACALVDPTSPVGVNNYTAESIVYSATTDTTEFKVQYSIIFNPLDVVFVKPKSSTVPETDNPMRDFFSSYTQYVIEISGNTYNILNYIEPDTTNSITLKVSGECFPGITGNTFSDSYIIRPSDEIVEGFYDELDILESTLLNRETNPIYQSNFYVPTDKNEGNDSDVVSIQVNWPVSRDGYNIQIIGLDYDFFVERLSSIAEEVDNYKSNLIVRFLTAPQLFEFDTEEKKIQSIFQIYGQSFDDVKKYIDNIAYMRNVSYDGINNIPDIFLKNLAETLGLTTANLFSETTLQEAVYTRHDTQYLGIPTGINLIEAEYEIYRRILVNLVHLYKSKGTRTAIEFFLKFIGAPDPMIIVNEYIYKVENPLPVNSDIDELINGNKVYRVATYEEKSTYVPSISGYTGTTGYTVTSVTGQTTLTRSEYPVDENTGLPRKLTSSDGSLFFENGAGWYKKTLYHRSSEILDTSNSDLTKKSKVIKSTPKPFTHGEDYFDNFRQLPGLYYGFNLFSEIDNKKIENVLDEGESKLILNRKNINVFLSPSQVIDYDIYRQSRNLGIDFGAGIPIDDTFEEFSSKVISENVDSLYDAKYDYIYSGLTNIYQTYENSTGFTPYNFTSVNGYVNKIGPNWINVIDQFIPATTLWLGGNLINNGIFGRSKYRYKPQWWYTYANTTPPVLANLSVISVAGGFDFVGLKYIITLASPAVGNQTFSIFRNTSLNAYYDIPNITITNGGISGYTDATYYKMSTAYNATAHFNSLPVGYVKGTDYVTYPIPALVPSPTPTPSLTRTPSVTPSITPSLTPSQTIPVSKTPTPTPSTSQIITSRPCGVPVQFANIYGSTYPNPVINVMTLGTGVGNVTLDFNSIASPDRYIVVYNGAVVLDTYYRGDLSYQTDLDNILSTGSTVTITGLTGPDYLVTTANITEEIYGIYTGTTGFTKTTSYPTTATVYVYSPLEGGWNYTLTCPQQPVPSRTPSLTPSKTPAPSPIPYYQYRTIEYVYREGRWLEYNRRTVSNVYQLTYPYLNRFYQSNNGIEECIFKILGYDGTDFYGGFLITYMQDPGEAFIYDYPPPTATPIP